MDIGFVANVAQIVSVIAAFLAASYGVYRRLDKRQHGFETELKLISQHLNFIVNQFGPNGGGLRQAVNEIGDRLSTIEDRQIDIGEKVARLDGQFEQHIAENDSKD